MRFGTIVFLMWFALFAVATAPARAGLVWGANGHPLVSYPGVSFKQQLDYIRDLGMTSYRVDVTSILKINALGSLVEAGKARGINILPVLIPSADGTGSSNRARA